MKSFIQDKFLFVFVPVVVLVLYANVTGNFTLYLIFKPLIVGTLLAYLVINNGQKGKAASYAIAGLVFSLLGDVLLIFEQMNPLFFMGGLISFLVAHLLYILYYIRSAANVAGKTLKNRILIVGLMVIYGIVFYILVYNNLGALKLPVFIYTSVLISMNIFALNRYGKVNSESFGLVMGGALFFACSDSLLALNKFLLPLPLAGVWILATYAVAQYLIIKGVLHSSQPELYN